MCIKQKWLIIYLNPSKLIYEHQFCVEVKRNTHIMKTNHNLLNPHFNDTYFLCCKFFLKKYMIC